MIHSFKMECLPKSEFQNEDLKFDLESLVNRVYELDENGLWKLGKIRTSIADLGKMIENGEIAVARNDKEIFGCIRFYCIEGSLWGFGMLAVDTSARGHGLGSALVKCAEQEAKKNGATMMELELIVPVDWAHRSKELLKIWYARLGYKKVSTKSVSDTFPDLLSMLATDCLVEIYRKELK